MKHVNLILFCCFCLTICLSNVLGQECIDRYKINPEQVCTKEYNPVCGCDGKTYTNACHAKRAGVTKFAKGKCPKGTPTLPTPCIDKSKVNLQAECPILYAPVCGCDGKTYGNKCEAEKMGITKVKKGKCPPGTKVVRPTECIDRSKINPQQSCTKEYNPVCGCDGKTYTNACHAKRAGVTKTAKGKCPEGTPTIPIKCIDKSKVNLQAVCPRVHNPVCGCDGRTYNNACEAEKMGVTKTKRGKCPPETKPAPPTQCIDRSKINPQQPCTKEYNPVCGCDGNTYANACLARKAGLTKFAKGKCPEGTKPSPPKECIDKSKINLKAQCPKVYNPVCGCNGRTYTNDCDARKAGITTFKKGRCK